MKRIINIFILLVVLTINSNAKIISVDGQFKLDLPLKHKYLNLKELDKENELFDYEYLK